MAFRNYKLFTNLGYSVIPITPGTKQPPMKNWQKPADVPTVESWANKYPDHGIGILLGAPAKEDLKLAAIDIDRDEYVACFKNFIPEQAPMKVGKKGLTAFVLVDNKIKSTKIKDSAGNIVFEILAEKQQTVIPPTIHPDGMAYRWTNCPLENARIEDLPVLTPNRIEIMTRIAKNANAKAIIDGGKAVQGHDLMLSLTANVAPADASLIPIVATALNALFHADYDGDTRDETLRMLQSAYDKGFALKNAEYDPGTQGPIPLGITEAGLFAIKRQDIDLFDTPTSGQLTQKQWWIGVADLGFLRKAFPADATTDESFAPWKGASAIINACRKRGLFKSSKIRGRGVWREGNRIIKNFTSPGPITNDYVYLCPAPIEGLQHGHIEGQAVLQTLQLFNWKHVGDEFLVLGWLAQAPLLGLLDRRPNLFIHGPRNTGKTTIVGLFRNLLSPIVLNLDGNSTEASIRQSIKSDSLPVVLDEFESDQGVGKAAAVIRLARSSYSADNQIARGSPEGNVMVFQLNCAFTFAAINPRGMTDADVSRTIFVELTKHTDDKAKGETIRRQIDALYDRGKDWCGKMINLAEHLRPCIAAIYPFIKTPDSRHNFNMATVLGAAFLAIHERVPNADEAEVFVASLEDAINRHAEEHHERDDATECLRYLLAHIWQDKRLVDWAYEAHQNLIVPASQTLSPFGSEAAQVLRNFNIRATGEGLAIARKSPNLNDVFQNTKYSDGAWVKALEKVDGIERGEYPLTVDVGYKPRVLIVPWALVKAHAGE